jgi:hypothetical protein
LHAITRFKETLFPVEARITSELKLPEGDGLIFGDGEYDSKPFLNKVADRGYLPVVLG